MTFEQEIKAKAELVFEEMKDKFSFSEQAYFKLALSKFCAAISDSLEQRTLR